MNVSSVLATPLYRRIDLCPPVDLASRKRARALMTHRVIDEFVSLSLNTYLVTQSRVTCANLFVEINKARYRNDRCLTEKLDELDYLDRSKITIAIYGDWLGQDICWKWTNVARTVFSLFFFFFLTFTVTQNYLIIWETRGQPSVFKRISAKVK